MKFLKYLGLGALAVLALGLAMPERVRIPVAGATARDWNARSFWFEPWGTSGVHKGIDIFGKLGTPVLSTTDGIVLFTGEIAKGGKVVLVLGPRWRLHYFAHLDRITTHALAPVASGGAIGTVGSSGNAQGKPPHLHQGLFTLISRSRRPLPACQSRRATQCVPLHTQGAQRRVARRQGPSLRVARPGGRLRRCPRLQGAYLAAHGRLAPSPQAGQRDPRN